jgi:hypothetical protein
MPIVHRRGDPGHEAPQLEGKNVADISRGNEEFESLMAKLQPVWDSLDDKERQLFVSALRLPEEGEVQGFDIRTPFGGLGLAETFSIAMKGDSSGPAPARPGGWDLKKNPKV